jgi:hypothetical protein
LSLRFFGIQKDCHAELGSASRFSLLGEILKQVQDDTSKRNFKYLWIGFTQSVETLNAKYLAENPSHQMRALGPGLIFIPSFSFSLEAPWASNAAIPLSVAHLTDNSLLC